MAVIAQVIEVIGNVLEAISKAMEMVSKHKGSDSMADTIDWLFVDGGKWSEDAVVYLIAAGIGDGIERLMSSLNRIKVGAGMESKMKIISMAVKTVGTFIDALSKVMQLMPEPSQATDMKKQLNQILWIIVDLTILLAEAIPYIVRKMLAIQVGNPKEVEPRLKVISTVMKVIGDFVNAMKKMMGLMPKATDMAEVKNNAETMFGGGGVLYMIISRLMGGGGKLGIPQLVKKIVDGAAKIDNPDLAAKQMAVVSSAMSAVSDFASAISNIMKILPDNAKLSNTEKLNSVLLAMHHVTKVVASHLPYLVGQILAAASKIKNPKLAGKQMAVIGQVMESVASFASAMESIQSLMPAAPAPGSGKKIKTVLEVVKPLACAISEHMPKVAGAIVGMFKKGGAAKDLYKYRHSIKALAGTFEAIGKFVTAMGELQKFEIAAGGTQNIGPLLTRLGGVFEGENKVKIEKLLKNFSSIKAPTKFPEKSFKNFGTFINGGLTPFVTALNAMPDVVAGKLDTIQGKITDLKKAMRGAASSKTFKDAVTVTNNLGKAGSVTVKGIPSKINLDIKITMDADKVAKALVKTKHFTVNG
jgi:hypothetical protein